MIYIVYSFQVIPSGNNEFSTSRRKAGKSFFCPVNGFGCRKVGKLNKRSQSTLLSRGLAATPGFACAAGGANVGFFRVVKPTCSESESSAISMYITYPEVSCPLWTVNSFCPQAAVRANHRL
eukprot:TRINITY_DN6316_c0_g1_i6.p1 TRINITY_DN6316_c0_g1~~TRINITY_DN6316_c0_g1_i6.p1  ORF type:complete len:122 (-),score=5.69 TRINITY_DN6316_c0_g1_i6:397-762(-)